MLGRAKYSESYIAACRASVKAQLASYKKLAAAKPAGLEAFETQFLNHMLLALDHYFMHRLRGQEGKDGNPLNEVRMLSDSVMENDGRLAANSTIKYKPESSILKLKIGEEIRCKPDQFAKLAEAFFDEMEAKFT